MFPLALRELGPRQLSSYARYRLGLLSGYYRYASRNPRQENVEDIRIADLFALPERNALQKALGEEGRNLLIEAADEALNGKVRLFGGDPVALRIQPPGPLQHWTTYELNKDSLAEVKPEGPESQPDLDIKFTWEPARLGWAILLARAYHLSADESYSAAFWERLEEFLAANPPYLGLNWVSGQEAALRLIGLFFCWQIFRPSPHSTPLRAARLSRSLVQHARRIQLTLDYARAQNNNHLLSEAAGLYTAGLALPGHPQAPRWRSTGWAWFQRGLQTQIAPDGAYIQHSVNYQRLMLTLSLWMNRLSQADGRTFPADNHRLLEQSTRWLLSLLDDPSGNLPNLGPNDGAEILPMSVLPFRDYRPVLKAAAALFLQKQVFGPGLWDETSLWLGLPLSPKNFEQRSSQPRKTQDRSQTPHTLHSASGDSWAYFRAARFAGRPGHADQLHIDLWWRGLNVACDAGSYLYNAPPPWQNSLAGADIHNTLTVNGLDQMQRAGRFLYLNWAQARVIQLETNANGRLWRMTAEHDGYRKIGWIHRRTLTALPNDGWRIEDQLLPSRTEGQAGSATRLIQSACLQWLLPDWLWMVTQTQPEDKNHLFKLELESPRGAIELRLSLKGRPNHLPAGGLTQRPNALSIVRAGEMVYGSGAVKPAWGWISPTYGKKIPGLSIRLSGSGLQKISFQSEWRLGDKPAE